MLAIALDAEELDDYNQAILTSIGFNSTKKSFKRWKWSSPDKAGTIPISLTGKDGIAESVAAFALMHGGNIQPSAGGGEQWAKATGRTIAYLTDDGQLIDKEGVPVEKADVILPIAKKKVS